VTRVRTMLACALLVLLVAYPAAQAQASPTLDMIAKINDLRSSHGLRTLQVSPSLMHSAHRYSAVMMSKQYFGHASRIQASAKYKRLGEIIEIHRGGKVGIGLTFSDWLHSPEHLGVMLDPSFTYVGGGYTAGRFQGHENTIWVVHFGKL
jgi:uncharacterized protein YkwD